VTPRPHHTERSTLAACIAHVAGASAGDVPLDRDEQRAWLAERGLGLVPVADAATLAGRDLGSPSAQRATAAARRR
jgi:hypothetical protein